MRWTAPVLALLVACAASPSAPAPVPTTEPSPTTFPAAPGTAPTLPSSLPPLRQLAYRDLGPAAFPIIVTARPGDDAALLAERAGRVFLFADGAIGGLVLDIRHLTTTSGERGLLGLARHPDDDRRLFVHYTDSGGRTVVSEFEFDGVRADPASERALLRVDQPASNHNGGMIQFGGDGALYLGLGDGGGAGDRYRHGQNLDTLLGGLVRIDVEQAAAELWHHGLRNPWRFWIDGDSIWIADVGQSAFEEINLADVTRRGVNHGWPIMEGAHCYEAPTCDTTGLHLPLVSIPHGDSDSCSITGGVVYRGSEIPELAGRFLFSDFCGGYLRSVGREGDVIDHTVEVGRAGRVVSFGVDGEEEVYVLTTDRIYRLEGRR